MNRLTDPEQTCVLRFPYCLVTRHSPLQFYPVAHAYPLMLDVTDRHIVIVGGGAVASRKCTGLIAVGATHIRVIAPEFQSVFPAPVQCITKLYDRGDLENADLVFAATDSPAVNDAVVQDARLAKILVNRADGSDEFTGDFVTPAKFETGPIVVTVSAQSAALAAVIRDGLKHAINPDWVAMADAMQSLRPFIKSSGHDARQRAELFRLLATPSAFAVLRESGIDGLKTWITGQHQP